MRRNNCCQIFPERIWRSVSQYQWLARVMHKSLGPILHLFHLTLSTAHPATTKLIVLTVARPFRPLFGNKPMLPKPVEYCNNFWREYYTFPIQFQRLNYCSKIDVLLWNAWHYLWRNFHDVSQFQASFCNIYLEMTHSRWF